MPSISCTIYMYPQERATLKSVRKEISDKRVPVRFYGTTLFRAVMVHVAVVHIVQDQKIVQRLVHVG